MLKKGWLDEPSAVFLQTADGWRALAAVRSDRWQTAGAEIAMEARGEFRALELEAPDLAVFRIKIRWSIAPADSNIIILGDHWERGYGDLEWRGIVPERVLPWYFLMHDGVRTNGCGVKTGAGALCYWQLDADGVTFTADVSSGCNGVRLGERLLPVAELVYMEGSEGEMPFAAARRFCAVMCERPVLPRQPVYGGNNWYYAYGNSSHREMLEDARFVSSLSSHRTNRPYMVLDDGWQLLGGGGACNGGPWIGNSRFPDMRRLAGEMKELGVKPGIWCRPLLSTAGHVPAEWIRYSAKNGDVLDPSVPEALESIRASVARMAGWGFELLKHDFTTFDLLGQWGLEMKSRPHALPHAFRDGSRTTAEITLELYRTIAEASGEAEVIGCNTIGQLSAGVFAIQRTGDDTSGKWWERTRYMGVNTLAFRMPQHGTFYSHDADCVGLTKRVPWELNRQWLRLLAASGTPLFVSASPQDATKEQAKELARAFAMAAEPMPPAEPLDWLRTTCPSRWLLNGTETVWEWNKVTAELLGGDDNGWWI